jgi:hypothetical protein
VEQDAVKNREVILDSGWGEEWDNFKRVQIKMFPKTRSDQFWPNKYRAANSQEGRRIRILTLDPILDESEEGEYNLERVKVEGVSKTEGIIETIGMGSVNWMTTAINGKIIDQAV